MKKRILTGLLAGAMTLALAATAMAAQATFSVDGESYFRPTTAVIGGKTLETNSLSRGQQDNKFKADGTTNYPYEVYLPNEQAPANYRIHTNYTKNTDACAACHATHTAVGSSLLQWYTVYDACMACHDGTVTTTYNVQEGEIGVTGSAAFGGMFGNGTQGSLSTHNVTGAMEIAAAPGGSVVGETVPAGANKHEVTRWATEFGCESCHTPHGQGGNARILHPDANGTATKMAQGKKFTASANADGSWSVKPALDDEEAAVNAVYNGYYFLNGYPYTLKVVVDNVEKKFGYTVDNKSGYTKVTIPGTTVASDVYFEGVPSLKVTMQISEYLKEAEDVKHQSGMNLFCGACHTDYNTAVASQFEGNGEFAGSGSAETGVYSKAHRHQVGFQWHGDVPGLKFEVGQKGEGAVRTPYVNETNYGMECLTCHVAHGTSEDYWETTLVDTGIWASTMDLNEIAGSSALKRMPNMGTCEACHNKADGNQGYSANTAQADVTPTANVADVSLSVNWLIGKPIANANGATWVGSAKCESCHAEKVAGWKSNKHYSASSVRTGAGCGSFNMDGSIMNCHQLGTTAMGLAPIASKVAQNTAAKAAGSPFYYLTSTDRGVDSAVTCEACHGSAKQHIQAPSTKNIFNPNRPVAGDTAQQAFDRKIMGCSRCHNDREDITGKTVAQINDGTIHDGPSSYASSKHYTSGLVACSDCHDAHAEGAGALKLEYEQLCATCHDGASIGSIATVMGGGADHTFAFGVSGGTMIPNGSVATINPNSVSSVTYAQVVANNVLDRYRVNPSISIVNGTTKLFSFTGGTWKLEGKTGATVADNAYSFSSSNGRIEFKPAYFTDAIKGQWSVSYTNTSNPTITAPATVVIDIQ